MALTADQIAADKIGRAIDGQIRSLQVERSALQLAAARIVDIDAELLILSAEQTRINPRRPPAGIGPNPLATTVS